MKNLFLVKIVLLTTALTITNAYAVIIEGSFNGTVRSFTNGAEDVDLAGYWDNVIEGSAASGSFWYDTEKAPQNTSDFTTSSFYQSYTDTWMGSTFNIDGKTFNISELPLLNGNALQSEGVWLFNFEPDIDQSTQERFYLFDNITSDDYPSGYASIGLMVSITSYEKPLLNGLGIKQEFDWYDVSDPTSIGESYISIATIVGDTRKEGSAWIDINEFHLNIKNKVDVPEPSPILLLLLGIFALVIKRVSPSKNFS